MAGHRHRARGAAAVLMTAVVATVAVGCSDSSGSSSSASNAASAAASVASQASSAAASLASQAGEALSSATAEAKRRLDEVRNGVDVKNDVKLGTVATDSGGHATVPVTAHNTAGSTKSFAVQVTFKDKDGNLLDTVVVTVADVAAGQSGQANANSHRTLSGDVRAEVAAALRY